MHTRCDALAGLPHMGKEFSQLGTAEADAGVRRKVQEDDDVSQQNNVVCIQRKEEVHSRQQKKEGGTLSQIKINAWIILV